MDRETDQRQADQRQAEYKRLFRTARSRAERAGITWRLALDDFIALWEPHWAERRSRRLQLNRNGYAGAYERGNVRVDTQANHVRDQHARQRADRGLYATMRTELTTLWETATPQQIELAHQALKQCAGSEAVAALSLGLNVTSFRILLSRADSTSASAAACWSGTGAIRRPS